ncbi:hypothetical protein LPJ66_000385 [Kickxella alabastrina]|uniref:Uncharacterized protein n=1 Tax=Kickxella alabastrina TaxID=61397 RepID=A0ACC1IWF1_9FUNG|nr:hypothetical protein LPJ66_000385 [Kickxella alabastrina]
MLVKYNSAFSAVLAALLCPIVRGLEVDLEWDIGVGAKGISTAMSMLRFANSTAPPATEWVSLGWSYGTMSLQHRKDKTAVVSMQILPPSANHQVILGKTSDISDAKYLPALEGPSQVFLESKVELDASVPYYFKVEAHHDLLQNRTTYEGLYSMGNHWMYMGSLVLQHPNDLSNRKIIGTQIIDDESNEQSKTTSETISSAGDESTATESTNTEKKRLSGKRKDSMSSGSTNSGSESDSDSGNDSESDSESGSAPKTTRAPRRFVNRLVAVHNKQMFDMAAADHLDGRSQVPVNQKSVGDFMQSGFHAIKANKLPEDSMSTVSANLEMDPKRPLVPLSFLKNGINFPDFVVFPKLYSAIRRMEGADTSLMRAGVYKKFQLRDRLGEVFFITKGRAFSYDYSDEDITSVRHFFMSASYLLSIDGARLPEGELEEKTEPESESSLSSVAESTEAESAVTTGESSTSASTKESSTSAPTSSKRSKSKTSSTEPETEIETTSEEGEGESSTDESTGSS